MRDDLHMLEDEELARRALEGNMECFEQLVYRYEGRLLGFLSGKAGNRHDAEDLTQRSFMAAFRNLHRFDHSRRFAPWLYTIASRLAIDHARARRQTEPLVESLEGTSRSSGDDRREEAAERLWDTARRTLSDDQFTALRLKYADGMSVKETAVIMRKSAVHVKVLLHRARRALAAELGGGRDAAGLVDGGSGS